MCVSSFFHSNDDLQISYDNYMRCLLNNTLSVKKKNILRLISKHFDMKNNWTINQTQTSKLKSTSCQYEYSIMTHDCSSKIQKIFTVNYSELNKQQSVVAIFICFFLFSI